METSYIFTIDESEFALTTLSSPKYQWLLPALGVCSEFRTEGLKVLWGVHDIMFYLEIGPRNKPGRGLLGTDTLTMYNRAIARPFELSTIDGFKTFRNQGTGHNLTPNHALPLSLMKLDLI